METAEGVLPGTVYECRAKGLFRKNNIKPLPGDIVTIESAGDGTGQIIEIAERKNFLKRPSVANIDCLIVVSSAASPSPNTLIIDKLLAFAANRDIGTAVVISKSDLNPAYARELTQVYKRSGISAFDVSIYSKEDMEGLKSFFSEGKIYALAGNTGVGKSSLLNSLDSSFSLPTGEISDKLGRGRHTTRQVELFHFLSAYIADTPGFSSFELDKGDRILKDDIAYCFVEFREYIGQCKFTGCSHVNDKGCAVRKAVEDGLIPESRHKSYVAMYNEVKDIKEWE